MSLRKEFVLKSVEVDLETGVLHVKWLNRIIERVGTVDNVLIETPHRKAIAKDDTETLNADIPDPTLRADIKKIARWTK